MRMHPGRALLMLLAAGCLLLAGCASSSALRKDADPARLSEGEMERRAQAHAHYAQGVLLELEDKPAEAIEAYHEAALLDPRDEDLVLDISRKHLRQHEAEKAIELLELASLQPEPSAAVLANLGLAYAQSGRIKQGIKANQRAIKLDPRVLAGHLHLYHLNIQAGKTNEALQVLERAADVPGVDAGYLIDLAETYSLHGRQFPDQDQSTHARALELLERAADLHPQEAHLQLKLADGLTLLGETKLASGIYEQLLQRYENMPLMRDSLRGKLTSIYLRNDDRKQAMEQLEAVLRDEPTDARACFHLGVLAYEDMQLERAEDAFRRTMLLRAEFEPVYYELAKVLISLGKPAEAVETLNKARTRFGESFSGEFLSAMALQQQKQYREAVNHYTTAEVIARADDPERLSYFFYFQFGAACERSGDYDQSDRYLRKAIELKPDYAEAMNYLGYTWAERGVNLERAKELIEHALEQEPKSEAYLDSLGWVLYRMNQLEPALQKLREAVENSEEPDPTILDHLGDVQAALGHTAEARKAWEESLEVEENEQVRKKLDSLGAP